MKRLPLPVFFLLQMWWCHSRSRRWRASAIDSARAIPSAQSPPSWSHLHGSRGDSGRCQVSRQRHIKNQAYFTSIQHWQRRLLARPGVLTSTPQRRDTQDNKHEDPQEQVLGFRLCERGHSRNRDDSVDEATYPQMSWEFSSFIPPSRIYSLQGDIDSVKMWAFCAKLQHRWAMVCPWRYYNVKKTMSLVPFWMRDESRASLEDGSHPPQCGCLEAQRWAHPCSFQPSH